MTMPNEDKLNQLIGKMLNDLGGTFSVPTEATAGPFNMVLEART